MLRFCSIECMLLSKHSDHHTHQYYVLHVSAVCNLDPTSEGFETAEPLMLFPRQDVTITNNSTHMGFFKVRTNSRHRYIVQPDKAYLKPGESKQLKIKLRKTEVASIQKDKKSKAKKTDTFLVQFVNLKTVFYYNQPFFDSIKIDTWLDKAGKLIKQVEKDNPTAPDRLKFFQYEKIYVAFPGDFASGYFKGFWGFGGSIGLL